MLERLQKNTDFFIFHHNLFTVYEWHKHFPDVGNWDVVRLKIDHSAMEVVPQSKHGNVQFQKKFVLERTPNSRKPIEFHSLQGSWSDFQSQWLNSWEPSLYILKEVANVYQSQRTMQIWDKSLQIYLYTTSQKPYSIYTQHVMHQCSCLNPSFITQSTYSPAACPVVACPFLSIDPIPTRCFSLQLISLRCFHG